MKTFNTLSSSTRLAAFMALSIGMLGAAAANADHVTSDARAQQVSLAGLDLSTAEGQQAAQARLYEAARTQCTRVADELDLSHQANFVKCVDSAVANSNQRLQALISQQSTIRVASAK